MDELSELRERIAVLEQKLTAIDATIAINEIDGDKGVNANRDNWNPVNPVSSHNLSAFDVVWYPKPEATPAWYVYYPGDCFDYKGMTPETVSPLPDEDGFIGTTSTASSTSIYLHAVIGLDNSDEEETNVKSLTFDTNQTKTPGQHEKVIDINLAKIDDYSVYQIVKGKIVYGEGASSYTHDQSPFQIVKTSTESEGQTVVTVTIENNTFIFNNSLKSVSNFTVPDGSVTVYLCGQFDLQTGTWTFSIATSPIEESSSNRVVNYKLYDFVNKSVTMDYRTTFMTAFDGINGIYGNDNGSGGDAEIIAGELHFIGADGSGLTVSTKKTDGMKIDLDGRNSEDEFAIHEIKDDEETTLAKFLGTSDVTLQAEGSSISADATFNVIVDLRYSTSTGYIQVKTRQANVEDGKLVSFGNESEWTNKIETTPISGV